MKNKVIVTGYHRGGTSILTRILVDNGYSCPGPLEGRSASNPLGHYENSEIVRFSNEVLSSRGLEWSTSERIILTDTEVSVLLFILRKIEEKVDKVVVKDPRILLYLESCLEELKKHGWGVLLISRNHTAIRKSLERRGDVIEGLERHLQLYADIIQNLNVSDKVNFDNLESELCQLGLTRLDNFKSSDQDRRALVRIAVLKELYKGVLDICLFRKKITYDILSSKLKRLIRQWRYE